jgi:hypothetical protein
MPMNDSPSCDLLARLATARLEDSCTEVLAELLRYREFREAFFALLAVPEIDGPWSIRTQAHNVVAAGRPDLVLDAPDARVVVESKVWAHLTDHQPNEYVVEMLASGRRAKTLAFLVPSSRQRELERLVVERLSQLALREPRVAEVAVRFVSWSSVRDQLARVDVADPVVGYIRDSFGRMVEVHIARPFLEMTDRRMKIVKDPEIVEAFIALHDLVNALRARLLGAGETVTACRGGDGWFGFYSTSGGYQLWLGLFLRAAVADGGRGSLLWAQLPSPGLGDRVVQAGRIVLDADKVQPLWGGLVTPLHLREGGLDAQVEDLLGQVLELRTILGAATQNGSAIGTVAAPGPTGYDSEAGPGGRQ